MHYTRIQPFQSPGSCQLQIRKVQMLPILRHLLFTLKLLLQVHMQIYILGVFAKAQEL